MDNNELAPLAVCAYNRATSLKNTLDALARNDLAAMTSLYIYVDGPRHDVEGEASKVNEVIAVARAITGFKTVTVTISSENKGLAASITGAATQLLNQCGRVIVVEDDLYCSRSFLSYMNQMLNTFAHDNRVMQVSGYGCKISRPSDYPHDIYLNRRAHSWTWATWKDRWDAIDWQVSDYDQLAASRPLRRAFNSGGSDLFDMLKGWKEGRNNSWFIRFNYAMHKQGRYAVCPVRSLVRNDGFGDEATNCSNYNRYKVDFEDEHPGDFAMPSPPSELIARDDIIKDAIKYWSIPYRIYGKIMTKLKR